MVETRRTFTDDQKREVLAYAKEHGREAALEKFGIVSSMYSRWKKQFAAGPGRTKKWTPEKVAGVLEYLKTHSNNETIKHFKISSAQIHHWKTGKPYYKRANGNGKANGHSLNGLSEQDALMHLERWRAAYLSALKAETPLAADVLTALRK